MRIERVSGKEERRIVIGMIVDPLVCGRIATKWERNLFQSKWANIVGELCVKYHTQYGKAPGKAIEGMFDAWSTEARDKDTVELVDRFLGGLSDEYEDLASETNSGYLIDVAEKHFTRNKLKRLSANVDGDIDAGDVDKALRRVREFAAVEMGNGAGIDVLQDVQALERAFAEKSEPLFTMPGALNEFFGNSLTREGFLAFLAPEKRGKTWWLCEMAWRAMLHRLRVAFFSVGDESQEEMMMRFCIRAAKWPMYPKTLLIPKHIRRGKDDPEVETMERVFEKGLSFQRGAAAFYETMRYKIKSKRSFLRLAVYPNSSLTVSGIDDQLKVWEQDDWVPDVIITDYMDILLESGAGDEHRQRINQTWKDMRGLTQRWHALGISATQADAASYDKHTMGPSNFSEDKRKLAHVTGMVGINQTFSEKDKGIMRLNWIVRRGAGYNSRKTCIVAGNLEVGNPCIVSCG
jgi:hypothetical protein